MPEQSDQSDHMRIVWRKEIQALIKYGRNSRYHIEAMEYSTLIENRYFPDLKVRRKPNA